MDGALEWESSGTTDDGRHAVGEIDMATHRSCVSASSPLKAMSSWTCAPCRSRLVGHRGPRHAQEHCRRPGQPRAPQTPAIVRTALRDHRVCQLDRGVSGASAGRSERSNSGQFGP